MNEALQLLLHLFAGWVSRQQLAVIEYLREENRVLREQLGGRRLRLTDAQRRRLAVKGHERRLSLSRTRPELMGSRSSRLPARSAS